MVSEWQCVKCSLTFFPHCCFWPPRRSLNWFHDRVSHELDLYSPRFASLILCSAVAPYPYGNTTNSSVPTITGSSSPRPTGLVYAQEHARSYCCFVIQDTVSPVFWASMNSSQSRRIGLTRPRLLHFDMVRAKKGDDHNFIRHRVLRYYDYQL